jgi:fermentation-respiration switch protein FrsA (DUF1100 family)
MIRLLEIAALIYVGLVAVLFVAQRSLIYHPSDVRPDPVASGVPEMKPVDIVTADGLTLLAWWHPPQRADVPVVLYLHGNAGTLGHRGARVRPYLDRGWGVLLLAWRGFSGNEGRPTEDGLYADGRAAIAFLDRNEIAPDHVVLYGESLGSGIAVQLAVERTPRAIVLEAPFSSLPDAAAAHYPIFPVHWIVRDRYDSAAKIGAVKAPVLIVHGERDTVVPVARGRKLLAAAGTRGEGVFLPEAGHNDLHDFGVAAAAIGFVERHSLPQGTPPKQ